MIARLGRYLLGSFPPAFYLPYALAWSLGGTAMFALGQRGTATWRPGWGTVATVATFTVLLLIIRAVDDLRDLEYDREHNPRRPLPSGAVAVSDLAALLAVGTIAVFVVNLARGGVWAAALAPVAYVMVLLAADRLLGWPPGDAIVLGAVISLPVQLLLGLYLYAAMLHDAGRAAGSGVILPPATMFAVFTHLELARKTTRSPRPGERTYVTVFGVQATAVTALAAAAVATLLTLLLAEPWTPGHAAGWLVLAPAALPVRGAVRFWRGRAVRWPQPDAGFYLLAAFAAFLVVDLAERTTP
ncbi:MAG TPA: UbiA family prenyltransferase [Actinocrinis sp.]|nr:UbiA family prenyltransferase [Actinocrinis sp.]